MGKSFAISLHSGNSTFVPSGWFRHAWSQFISMIEKIRERTKNTKQTLIFELTHKIVVHNWANINVGN